MDEDVQPMRMPTNKQAAAAIDSNLFMKTMVLLQSFGQNSSDDDDERAVESASLREALIGINEGDLAIGKQLLV